MTRPPRARLVAACLVTAVVGACQPGPTPNPSTVVANPSGALTATLTPDTGVPGSTTSPASLPPASAVPEVVATELRWRLPQGISRAVAFADGASLLLAGGLTAGGTTGAIVDIALDTGTVTPAGTLASKVHDAGGARIAGAPAVLGGGDAVAGTAVQGIHGGVATVLGDLPKARADLSVVDLGGVTYIVGGGTTSHPDPLVLATTDGATFSTVARLPVPVRYAAVAAVGGSIIVVGGSDGTKDRTEIQAIDPASGSAAIIGHLPRALSHAAALVLGGRLLVAGGRIGKAATDSIWLIDPSAGVATVIGRLPRAVSDAAAVVIDGVGYLVGGEDVDFLRTVISIRSG
jgi:hypothetical protein